MKFKYLLILLLLAGCSYSSFGQKKSSKLTISGTVVDAQNKPVEGAVIFIDKVKTSTVTDQQGHYKLKVSAEAKEILAFTLFYGAAKELIDGRETIDFIVTGEDTNSNNPAPSIRNADETRPEKTLGVVDGQNPEFASYQTIYDMIRGRFAGVEVSGNSIKVMGSSSLNVSTEPLFVVDGIIVNSIDDISPQTIKSIEVLKGPDASEYGMRGANGVIVIKRLTGKDKK